ncbi:MAG: hypothetical protein ACLS8J_01365 [Streptococcus salivarius]
MTIYIGEDGSESWQIIAALAEKYEDVEVEIHQLEPSTHTCLV